MHPPRLTLLCSSDKTGTNLRLDPTYRESVIQENTNSENYQISVIKIRLNITDRSIPFLNVVVSLSCHQPL